MDEEPPFPTVQRISKDAWLKWARNDPESLKALMKKCKLIVRVPVERQKKPKGTMD